jgi:hypothetical protein
MSTAVALSFQVDDLPAGLRFDGIQKIGDGLPSYLQFTELDKQSASFGASFYVDSRAALLDAILSRREEKRIAFAAGSAPAIKFENGVAS